MENTLWGNAVVQNAADGLKNEIERDVVVIGGGLSGVLTAYRLAESGKNVTLLEADKIGSGVSRCSTAHIEALQGILYSKLNSKTARAYFKSQIEAINELDEIVKKHSIDCGFKRVDSIIFEEEDEEKLKREYEALLWAGAEADLLDDFEFRGEKKKCAVKLKNQAQFDPIKFLSGLPKNFEIVENARVIKINFKYNLVFTRNGSVKAKKIVVATNFPIEDFPGWYFVKMYKSHSYVSVFENVEDLGALYQSSSENGMTFRSDGKNLIVGGLDHRTGRIDCDRKYETLEEKTKRLFPEAKRILNWSANDCVTFDHIPYAGYFSQNTPDAFILTGYNKWGVANSMICSKLVSDMILGNENEYKELFDPARRKIGLSFAVNALCVAKNLVLKPLTPCFSCAKNLESDSGKITMLGGKKKAVYKDADGKLHVCQPLCAHLKCQLVFNPNDKTWDCPCHGSRFDVDGKIIVSPTISDLKCDTDPNARTEI